MELADLVSTTLNKAQSASNKLIANQPEKAEIELESLCDFLMQEMIKPEAQPEAVQAAAETPAGEQPEKSQEQVTEPAPGAAHNVQQPEAEKPEQETPEAPGATNTETENVKASERPAHYDRSQDQR